MARAISFEGRGTSGPPVVLIHAFPVDRAIWQGQLEGLGTIARVVALDLPGFGATPPADDGATAYTVDDMSGDVLAVADALGFERFVVGGCSMGGYVALALARRHPDRLCGLALCDTRAEPDTPEARRGRAADADRVLAEGCGFLVEKHLHALLAPATLAHRRDLAVSVEAMIRRASPAGVAGALRGLALRPDARPDLAAISTPTLVLGGAEDTITPPAAMRELAAAIPGADLAIVRKAGHLAPLEAPDQVAAALRTLVRRSAQHLAAAATPPPPRTRARGRGQARDYETDDPTDPGPSRGRRGPGVAR